MTVRNVLPDDLKKAGDLGKRQASLDNLINVMEQCGWKNPAAQAAILGVVGGESGFIPCEEKKYTSLKSIRAVQAAGCSRFSKWTDAEVEEQLKKSKPEFFGWMYGTSYKSPKHTFQEGSMYFGKGYIQLTFKASYLGAKSGVKALFGKEVDYVDDPTKVVSISEESAMAVMGYFYHQKRCRDKSQFLALQNQSNIFQIILGLVGGVTSSHPKKKRYYEHFLAGTDGVVPNIQSMDFPKPTNKDAGSTDTQHSETEIKKEPPQKQEALYESRNENFSIYGFTDPFGKYPLREYMNEADTNRLARGIIKNTDVEFKDSIRNTSIPLPNGATYDQPSAPYSAKYPFNKVMESEGGHVLEFDDTPGAERINLFHRKGTFIEIDNNGTQVNHIVGDGYYIIERNGYIFTKGACNITTSGHLSVMCLGNAEIEANGSVDITSHDCASLNVARDLAINVGENLEISVGKNFNIEIGNIDANKKGTPEKDKVWGGITLKSKGQIEIETQNLFSLKTKKSISTESQEFTTINSKGNLTLNTDAVALYESKLKTSIKANDRLYMTSKTDMAIKSDAKLFLNSKSEMDLESGSQLKTTSKGKTSINSHANVHLTAKQVHLKADKVPLHDYVKVGALKPKGMGNAVAGAKNAEFPKVADSPVIPPIDVKYNPLSKITIGDEDNFKNTTSESLHFKRVSLIRHTEFPNPIGQSETVMNQLQPCDRMTNQAIKFEDESDLNDAVAGKVKDSMFNPSNTDSTTSQEAKDEQTIDPNDSTGNRNQIYRSDKVNDKENKKSEPNDSIFKQPKTITAKDSEIYANTNGMNSYPPTFKLSEHFTLSQLVAPGTIIKDITLPGGSIYGNSKQNLYTVNDLIHNMAALSENILEYLYSRLGPCGGVYGANDPYAKWQITSGIATLNHTGGRGKHSSDHFKGRAVDFQYKPKNGVEELYNLAVDLSKNVPNFSQIIMEYASASSYWIHLAYTDGKCNNGQGNDGSTNIKNKKTMRNGSYFDGIILYR